jgi:predicted O-methyltransferase YrrM
MEHPTFIKHLASIYKPNTYVELGLYEGETLRLVQPYAKRIHGIDMKTNAHIEQLKAFANVQVHICKTDDFFETFHEPIDMAFIDADHCVESALKDFENILKRLAPNGIVLLHDTDPIEDKLIQPGYCGDSYKIVSILEQREDVNIITLPLAGPGLSMVTKKNGTRTLLRHALSRISPS